ncbi:hypothetical protein NDU88_003629 [Pleurodeles waltl]|uniref:Uncharacterized protein n=1 Tax=Pleurodeles waltl TaxID=8319 RepID=A0AAV7M5X2_PLEWA|nr:hypothetical protein NDU88_003629 [Pleurodeles waltl]
MLSPLSGELYWCNSEAQSQASPRDHHRVCRTRDLSGAEVEQRRGFPGPEVTPRNEQRGGPGEARRRVKARGSGAGPAWRRRDNPCVKLRTGGAAAPALRPHRFGARAACSRQRARWAWLALALRPAERPGRSGAVVPDPAARTELGPEALDLPLARRRGDLGYTGPCWQNRDTEEEWARHPGTRDAAAGLIRSRGTAAANRADQRRYWDHRQSTGKAWGRRWTEPGAPGGSVVPTGSVGLRLAALSGAPH